MKRKPQTYYTATQKALMWDLYKKGESLHTIGKMFDRGHTSVGRILSMTGGIRPADRVRSSRVLSLEEREEISRGIVSGQSIRMIALQLNRSPSTISREISRHGGYDDYRATNADKAAWDNARRPNLASYLVRNLLQGWLL